MYRHRQTSYWPTAVSAVATLLMGTRLIAAGDDAVPSQWFRLGFLTLYTLLRLAWTTLDTEVDDTHVRARFSPLGPGRVIPIDAITSHERVRFRWWFGYGGWLRIHGTGAWAFSVWGLDAVRIEWRDESGRHKRFHFGTNDAAGLDAALTNTRHPPTTTNPH